MPISTEKRGRWQAVQIVLACQLRLEQDYAADRRFCLTYQNNNEFGGGEEVIGEGQLGDVLMALLGELEREAEAEWELEYYGRKDGDGIPACVTPADAEDQRFYVLCAA